MCLHTFLGPVHCCLCLSPSRPYTLHNALLAYLFLCVFFQLFFLNHLTTFFPSCPFSLSFRCWSWAPGPHACAPSCRFPAWPQVPGAGPEHLYLLHPGMSHLLKATEAILSSWPSFSSGPFFSFSLKGETFLLCPIVWQPYNNSIEPFFISSGQPHLVLIKAPLVSLSPLYRWQRCKN